MVVAGFHAINVDNGMKDACVYYMYNNLRICPELNFSIIIFNFLLCVNDFLDD